MSSGLKPSGSRRDFFRSAARFGGLVALGAAFAWLERPRPGQSCVNNSICSGCSAFTYCGLPAALSVKVAGNPQSVNAEHPEQMLLLTQD